MKTKLQLITVLAAAALAVVLAQGPLTPPAGAPAPTMKTLDQIEARKPISTYGTNITTSGSYYLTNNLTSASPTIDGISVGTANVTIDFNGFAITNTAGDAVTAGGVTFVGRKNVTIRNGTIQGFIRGIFANGDCAGAVVENMRLTGNFLRGMMLNLAADGVGAVVRNNLVHNTGGTTVGAANQEVRGIELCCASFVVDHNTVVGVTGKGTSDGVGIHLSNSEDTFVVNNYVSRADVGIRMNGPNEYRDNFTSNCATPYVAGTNVGNNF